MLIRKTEPDQQKWLNQDEHDTRQATKRRKGVFFEDGKGQQVERDKKSGDGDSRLVGVGVENKTRARSARASTSRERIMRLLAKYQPKISPNVRTIYGSAAIGCCSNIGSPWGRRNPIAMRKINPPGKTTARLDFQSRLSMAPIRV